MDAKQQIHHYLKALFLELEQVIQILRTKPQEPESLHHFRLLLKRLNAWIALLNQLQNTQKIRLSSALKKLFRAAGKVRDLQIQMNWIPQLIATQALSDMEVRWERRIQNALMMLQRRLQAFSLQALGRMKRRLKRRLKSIKPTTMIVRTMHLLQKKLKKLSQRQVFRDEQELHQLRKKLKILQYWLELLTKPLKAGPSFALAYQNLKRITEELGQWHDRFLLIQELSEYGCEFACEAKGQIAVEVTPELNRLGRTIQQQLCWFVKDFKTMINREKVGMSYV